MRHDTARKTDEPALERLERILDGYGSLVVAYSGGVDSGLLAYVAHRVLGERMVAVLGLSPSLGGRERVSAVEFLRRHGIPHELVTTDEMDEPRYRANGPDRCYFCKAELFDKLGRFAKARGFAAVAYGANLDDRGDYRPGARAASERSVCEPLIAAGLRKDDVRDAARALGLSLWDKPAAPCLASRIPYHHEVTPGKLREVERAEGVLKDMGFRVCRVRHYDATARIEVPIDEMDRLRRPDVWAQVVRGIRAAGFDRVVAEERGFASGRLNEALRQPAVPREE